MNKVGAEEKQIREFLACILQIMSSQFKNIRQFICEVPMVSITFICKFAVTYSNLLTRSFVELQDLFEGNIHLDITGH